MATTGKTFMRGALILGAAGVLTKILGAFFRIPLANIIGDTGMGYYQTAYPIYVLLITLSTAGIPTAIARLVSERTAEEEHEEAYRIFRLSGILLFWIGVVTFAFLMLAAPLIAGYSRRPEAVPAMRAIAPALLFVPLMAAYKGYFQGLQDMTPTALAQIFEQLTRVITGLTLAVVLLPVSLTAAVAGASFGATVGSICGLTVIGIIFFRRKPAIREARAASAGKRSPEASAVIIRRIVLIAVPVTIGAAIMPIMNIIDLVIVPGRLVAAGFSAREANDLYGQLSGFVGPLINFPQTLIQGVAMSLVPAIAAAHQTKDTAFMKENISLGLRTAILFGYPCAVGFIVLAKPIMLLLYSKQPESAVSAAGALQVLAAGFLFLSMVQALTGILQGIRRQMIPVRNLLIGAVVKVILSFFLVAVPSLNICGAAWGTVAAYAVAFVLDLVAVRHYTAMSFSLSLTYGKPLLSSLIMGLAAWLVYHGVHHFAGNAVSVLVAILAGVVVYVVVVLSVRAITEEEIRKLPRGEQIANRLSRIRPGSR